MTHITKIKLSIFFCFIFSSYTYAAIYKWVDEDGQTHFGNQPPAQSDNKKVKENTGNSFEAERNSSSTASQGNSTGQQGSAKGNEKDNVVDCYAAVDHTKSSFKSLVAEGREKYKKGEMSYEKYRKGVDNLRKASRSASLSDCEKSKGDKREFYQCMNKGTGDASQAILCALILKFK